MVDILKKLFFPAILSGIVIFFYSPFIFTGKLPAALDTIVGLYHPYRDFYSRDYPRGVPFKNFLITDPVRQTYIWKELSIESLKKGQLPLWNPYEMTGKPLVGNYQSAAFYPLNLILFINFSTGWGLFIMSQTILLGIFCYIYLRNLKLEQVPSIMGTISFTFSGVVVSWLTWGTIVHTFLWMPLSLFAIDKMFVKRYKLRYALLLAFSIFCATLAGHPQSLFYVLFIIFAYFLLRLFEHGKSIKKLLVFLISLLTSFVLSFFQWVPFINFLQLSSRSSDRQFSEIEGWFLPWQHLIQFIAPDFFGNPATLNYSGVFNYGEFIGYIGIIPLTLVAFSIIKSSRVVVFYSFITILSFLMVLPSAISSLPFVLKFPVLESMQPTRLILLVCFSLSVLSAFGLNNLFKRGASVKKMILLLAVVPALVMVVILMAVNKDILGLTLDQQQVAIRNIFLPTMILAIGTACLLGMILTSNKYIRNLAMIIIVSLTIFDLMRFAQKYTPFVTQDYLYPMTKTIDYIQQQPGVFRIANMDRRLFAPNFLTHYKIQTVEGYDPLYLKTYAEYVASLERGLPNSNPPFGFNRILTPHNYNSQLFDFLNVKYVVSLEEINSPKLTKVFEEGSTKVYKNNSSFERAFFVSSIISEKDPIKQIFNTDLKETAIVAGEDISNGNLVVGKAIVTDYEDNSVKISTYNTGEGFLVLSDVYYPTWEATIDGVETKIYKTNHAFRGFFVPSGKHQIVLQNRIF